MRGWRRLLSRVNPLSYAVDALRGLLIHTHAQLPGDFGVLGLAVVVGVARHRSPAASPTEPGDQVRQSRELVMSLSVGHWATPAGSGPAVRGDVLEARVDRSADRLRTRPDSPRDAIGEVGETLDEETPGAMFTAWHRRFVAFSTSKRTIPIAALFSQNTDRG